MSNPIFGELLILFLLLLNSARIFFLKYGKIDALTVLAPLCAILSALQIIAWGADIFSLAVFVVSIFAFFTNFRALLRFLSGLYVDHYSIAFKSGAFFIIIMSSAIFAALIYFRPLNFGITKSVAKKEKIPVSGSFTSGFEPAGFFTIPCGEVYIYSPDPQISNAEQNKNPPIIFISDKRADSINYEPLFYELAEQGFKVYTGDFYARDLKWYKGAANIKIFRRFSMILDYIFNKTQFENQQDFFAFNSASELEKLLNFIIEREGQDFLPLFALGDWMSERALKDFYSAHSEDICGTLSLTDCADYKTKGFGLIEITNPLLALYLGFNRASSNSQTEKIAHEVIETAKNSSFQL